MAWTEAARAAAAATRKRNAKNKKSGGVDFSRRQIIMPRDPFKDKLNRVLTVRNARSSAEIDLAVAQKEFRSAASRSQMGTSLRSLVKPRADRLAAARLRALKATAQSNGLTVAEQNAKYAASRATFKRGR